MFRTLFFNRTSDFLPARRLQKNAGTNADTHAHRKTQDIAEFVILRIDCKPRF